MFRRLRTRIAEMIGTVRHVVRILSSRVRRYSTMPTKDMGRPDYGFWDRARRGKAVGLEVSGLFIKPLASKIASWTLGRKPSWVCENERSQEELEKWWGIWHSKIVKAWRESLALGDHFVVINADLTTTLLTPDQVDPIVNEDDYSQIIGWRITQIFEHPDRPGDIMTVVDEYTAEERVRTTSKSGSRDVEERYPNLIGLVPVVHIPNTGGSDEVFGRPEGEALIPALQRYGAVIDAGIDGTIRQGRATPVIAFSDATDLDRFWELYGKTRTQTLGDGTTETDRYIEFDADKLVTISNGQFDWKSPSSFSVDTQNLLGLLFYLVLQHTEIPEFIWGNAIASSQASAEAQLPPFIAYIDLRRGEIAEWIVKIAEVALAYLSLIEPGVVAETPVVQWEALTDEDKNLKFEVIKWAYTEGLLDRKTALLLAPVDVEDIESVLDAADQEREERAPEFGEPDPRALNDAMESEIARLEAGGNGNNVQ